MNPTTVRWSRVICKQPGNYTGWPNIARRPDGELLTVYYQVDQLGEKTSLMATRWSLS